MVILININQSYPLELVRAQKSASRPDRRGRQLWMLYAPHMGQSGLDNNQSKINWGSDLCSYNFWGTVSVLFTNCGIIQKRSPMLTFNTRAAFLKSAQPWVIKSCLVPPAWYTIKSLWQSMIYIWRLKLCQNLFFRAQKRRGWYGVKVSISCSAREEGEWGENLLLLALSNDALGRSGEVNRSFKPLSTSFAGSSFGGGRESWERDCTTLQIFFHANCVEGI